MEVGEYAYKQNQMLSEALKRFSTKMWAKVHPDVNQSAAGERGSYHGNPEEPTGEWQLIRCFHPRPGGYATLKRGQLSNG
jgi:hypothetical protein